MNQTPKANDSRKQSNLKSSIESQQIAWNRIQPESPTRKNRVFLIVASLLLLTWLVTLGILAWIS